MGADPTDGASVELVCLDEGDDVGVGHGGQVVDEGVGAEQLAVDQVVACRFGPVQEAVQFRGLGRPAGEDHRSTGCHLGMAS